MKKRLFLPFMAMSLTLSFCGITEAAQAARPYDLTFVRVIVNGQTYTAQAVPGEENVYKAFPAQASDWAGHVDVEIGWEWSGNGDDPGDRCRINNEDRPHGRSNQDISANIKGNDGKMTALFGNVDRSRIFEAWMGCRAVKGTRNPKSHEPPSKRYVFGERAIVRLSPNADFDWNPLQEKGEWETSGPCNWILKPQEGTLLTEGIISVNGGENSMGNQILYNVERATKYDTGVHGDLSLPEGKVYVDEWEEYAEGQLFIQRVGSNSVVWERNPPPGPYRLSAFVYPYRCPWVNFEIAGANVAAAAQSAAPAAAIFGAAQPVAPDSSPKGGFGSAAMAVKGGRSVSSATGNEESPSEGGRIVDPTAKVRFVPQPEPPAYRQNTIKIGEHPPEPGMDARVPRSGPGAPGFASRKRVASAVKTPLQVGTAELSIKSVSLSPSPLKAGATARLGIVFENGGKVASSSDANYGVLCTAVPAGRVCPVPVGTFAIDKAVPAGGAAGTTLLAAKPAEPGTFRVVVTVPAGTMKEFKTTVIEVAEPPAARKAKKKVTVPAETEPARESAPLVKPRLRTPQEAPTER